MECVNYDETVISQNLSISGENDVVCLLCFTCAGKFRTHSVVWNTIQYAGALICVFALPECNLTSFIGGCPNTG